MCLIVVNNQVLSSARFLLDYITFLLDGLKWGIILRKIHVQLCFKYGACSAGFCSFVLSGPLQYWVLLLFFVLLLFCCAKLSFNCYCAALITISVRIRFFVI